MWKNKETSIKSYSLQTPCGFFTLNYLANELQDAYFEKKPNKKNDETLANNPEVEFIEKYFQGYQQSYTHKLRLPQLSAFEIKVLQELIKVPYGQTISYQELAQKLKSPRAARAVGNALSRNPFLIFYPCHRIIRNNGNPGGFAGGTELKSKLLAWEKNCVAKIKF